MDITSPQSHVTLIRIHFGFPRGSEVSSKPMKAPSTMVACDEESKKMPIMPLQAPTRDTPSGRSRARRFESRTLSSDIVDKTQGKDRSKDAIGMERTRHTGCSLGRQSPRRKISRSKRRDYALQSTGTGPRYTLKSDVRKSIDRSNYRWKCNSPDGQSVCDRSQHRVNYPPTEASLSTQEDSEWSEDDDFLL